MNTVRLISGLGYLEHTTDAFVFMIYLLPITKLMEYKVIKFMRKFETNKLPDGFKNEWHQRWFKGGDGYMLRNFKWFTIS